MKITSIYLYPIKGLLGFPVQDASLKLQGLANDRRYMLLRVLPDGKLKSMHASNPLETNLFATALINDDTTIVVSYYTPTPPITPPHPAQNTTLEIPLLPDWKGLGLEQAEIEFNSSGTRCYKMGQKYDEWFSACFGFEVVLVFLGDGGRPVLGSMDPNSRIGGMEVSQGSWLGGLSNLISGRDVKPKTTVAFPDTGALLVVNAASLEDLHSRLEGDTRAEMKKFRPNIVLSSEDEPAWAEDYWAEISITSSSPEKSNKKEPVKIALTANCGRCWAVNIDFKTGKESKGPDGQLLKSMMRDRRVDKGMKYTPIFGRFAIPLGEGEIAVGDEVVVSKRNNEHTVFDWPGLTN